MATPVVTDIGTRVELTFTRASDGSVVDISGATTRQMRFQAPSGAVTLVDQDDTPAVTFVTDGTDGKIEYITPALHWAQTDLWRVQGRVVLGGGAEFASLIEKFRVERLIA